MFAKIWRFVVLVLALIGALFMVADIGRWIAGRDAPAAVEAPAVPAVEAPAGDGCQCAAGAVCTGPRGGRYCIKDDGGKRYL